MTAGRNGERRLRVGIVGAGYISKFHVQAARTAGADVVAICDTSGARAESLAGACGVEIVRTGLGEMLAADRLDVVHVLTPPTSHGAVCAEALAAGVHVLAEKPLCTTSAECDTAAAQAAQAGKKLGVSHNFLYYPVYERLVADLRAGRFGRLDQLEVVWNKELGQLRGGPFGGWLFARPTNVLFEIAPHSLAHVAHLVGEPAELAVAVHDRVSLPRGREFYRRWEVTAQHGPTAIRLRYSFIDAYPEHYIHVRGSAASATVDFERNTYVVREHTPMMLDVDRYVTAASAAADQLVQAHRTLGHFLLSKVGLADDGRPFAHSIARTVQSFYAGLDGALDERVAPGIGTAAVRLAERVAAAAPIPASAPAAVTAAPVAPPSTVLVLGGTGFIGQALVTRLRQAGRGVRLLARDPGSVPPELLALGLEVVRGDATDVPSVEAALGGIEHVYHLARGYGNAWADYVRTDVEPTRGIAEACLARGVKALYYTSSIAIYYAGRGVGPITEETAPHPGVLRTNLYARAKVEIEKVLLELHRTRGLPVVIFRPGIVLGRGGNPLHWGVAGWPYNSVSRLWGDGNNALPIVLVDDCADAMVRVLDVPGLAGQSFNLVGEPCLTAQEYLDELERASGLHVRRVPTSSARYFAEEVLKYAIKTLGRDPERRRPSFGDWEGRTFAARFDATRAKERLGWRPTADRAAVVREGIAVPAQQFLS